MPLMSMFRPKQPHAQLGETDCYAACDTDDDVQLVKLAIKTNKPVLVGLDRQSTILKSYQEGDEKLYFESLFDDCYTIVHLKEMNEAKVDTPEKVPLKTFLVDIGFVVALVAGLDIAVQAAANADVADTVRNLLKTDQAFRQAVFERIALTVKAALDHADELEYRITEATKADIEPPLGQQGRPSWRVMADK